MENQPGHPVQLGTGHQGFRPFTSLLLSTPSIAQQHASASVNPATIQMPAQPSHPGSGSTCPTPTYDGYSWMKHGQQTAPGEGCQVIYYKCTQANCGVQKSVAFSADGHIVETVFKGSHNHSCPSERWLPAVLPEFSASGTLEFTSSESEENDHGEAIANEDFTGDASTEVRDVQAPAERVIVQNGGRNFRRKYATIFTKLAPACPPFSFRFSYFGF